MRSHVLPGFQFRQADLYRLPEPPRLVVDDVYNHFISPYLRAERERAELAIQRAEEQQARAEAPARKNNRRAPKRKAPAPSKSERGPIATPPNSQN